jgi:hypothetical protein
LFIRRYHLFFPWYHRVQIRIDIKKPDPNQCGSTAEVNHTHWSFSSAGNPKQFFLFHLRGVLLFFLITVKCSNFVWDLYVVMGNTKSSFGPAQFICKLGDFFKKARFFLQILTWAFFQDLQNGYLGDYIIFENSLKFDLYLLMESKWRTH